MNNSKREAEDKFVANRQAEAARAQPAATIEHDDGDG